ncbi:D-amino-acid:oxygen oxidoreductase (deaminating) [Nocardioides albertanoniae]|uniref:D-amino-acid oxidase n=1 Tax=Nocardioides albertanoniae TaxID=1175486 RepID=A0A543A4V1_9ACTN|nr:FAD-dependent oxidoreductase [Nocardioides albertanoniae]TQL67506.1 D-amino-acid:oxygen oxidoreductase (deaminating) [Nocardioides albertanoniae]
MRVTVVGAGVIGLSCAVRLLEAGHRVSVIGRERTTGTTSAIAGGFWFPYLAEPRERVAAWAAETFHELSRLATDEPAAGVRMVHGAQHNPEDDLWWAAPLTDLSVVGGRAEFTAPIAEMPVYLEWLERQVTEAGGTVSTGSVTDLSSVDADVVVNATGLGARELVGDTSLYPVQGQVVVLEAGATEEWLEAEGSAPVYVLPRGGDTVVGGTSVPHAWSQSPDPRTAERILADAAALVPEIAHLGVRAHRVGLRPARPAVRLEREGTVVHCYGHGGAGVTLSWGCATEVAELVSELATK